MTVLRFLNPQGIVGIAVSLSLAILLVVQKAETAHWRRQSGQFEQLYRSGQSAFSATVSNYRAAAEAARAADHANLQRIAAEQDTINDRSEHEFEARIADVRVRSQRMHVAAPSAPTDPRLGRAAPMSGIPAPTGSAAQAALQDRLSAADAVAATEQAIQLDELIEWVRQQHAVRVDGMSGERLNPNQPR